MVKTATIDNVQLVLSNPVSADQEWIGLQEPLRQLMACWLTVADNDVPLVPRITGYPGIGKTTLAIAAARRRGQAVYIMQCTSDTRPEDLLVTPVLSEKGTIAYHASPLLTAVITGGIAILDEGNRMAEKSWASLAGLFDHRRMVESVVAGIIVGAHREFRAAVTMNEDSSTFEIPDYIMSRLQPGIALGFPGREDEMAILSYNLPFCDEEVLGMCVDFLQRAHALDLPYSVRDGINAIRYTLKQRASSPEQPAGGLFENAIRQILGDEALDLDSLVAKRRSSGENLPSMNLGDFFFPNDDPLNPDAPEDDSR
ncbi:MAG: AAA domain-containing protein [Chitinivibrionales bacterium]|nr:AAA domain-containing protein [Chitinivibrionales bacterium]MBD3395750.1 AAA domain-containing protein [Chitinivibrionales bacterium]